jgi:hypothetical protein
LYQYIDTRLRTFEMIQWSNLLLPTLIGLVVASRGFRMNDRYVALWAESAGIELTDETRPPVWRYLAWSRWSRTMGGLVGYLAPFFYSEIVEQKRPEGGVWVVTMLVGYFLGALVAEFFTDRPERVSGTASLVPRRIQDYLAPYVLGLQRGLGLVAALLAAAYAILSDGANDPLPAAQVVAIGAAGVCVAVVVEALQRAVVARRQAAATEASRELDDAMRSSSLHVLSGAAIGILLNIVGGEVMVLAGLTGDENGSPNGALGLVLMAVALLLLFSSITFWLDLAKPHGFRVRQAKKTVAA